MTVDIKNLRRNLVNLAYMLVGITGFFTSFHVGESSLLGGFLHLGGCASFCAGVHKEWCSIICRHNKR